jgi:hypothetical protein
VNLSAAWQPGQTPSDEIIAEFPPHLLLIGSEYGFTSQDNHIEVRLRWQVRSTPPIAPRVFVHLYDGSGNLIAQHDGPPAGGFVPWAATAAGDVVLDVHQIDIPAAVAAGVYRLATGLYDPATGTRLEAYHGGERLDDDLYFLGDLEIRPPGDS